MQYINPIGFLNVDYIPQSKIVNSEETTNVIIHFYKEIFNKYVLQLIRHTLESIDIRNIPVIVVTINKTESKEVLNIGMKSPAIISSSGCIGKASASKPASNSPLP